MTVLLYVCVEVSCVSRLWVNRRQSQSLSSNGNRGYFSALGKNERPGLCGAGGALSISRDDDRLSAGRRCCCSAIPAHRFSKAHRVRADEERSGKRCFDWFKV